jgi:hypothetical protein
VRVRTTELEPEASLPALRLGDVDLAISHENVSRPAPPASASRWCPGSRSTRSHEAPSWGRSSSPSPAAST